MRCIDELVRVDPLAPFRMWTTSPRRDPPLCQGDIVAFESDVPILAEDGGEIVAGARDTASLWMVIGNSCDLHRDSERFTQIVPVDSADGLEFATRRDLARYRAYRRFYLHPWPNGPNHPHIADFMRPVTIEQPAARDVATIVATMDRPGWVLLNACLVRFLGRDDGRLD